MNNSRLLIPTALAAALLAAGAAWGHRLWQAHQARRKARVQAKALQTWEGEGGALPIGPAVPAGTGAPQPAAGDGSGAGTQRRRVRASP